jgi:hypothetical protein
VTKNSHHKNGIYEVGDLAYLGVASISSMNISFETEPESSAHAASAQEEPTESDIRHHAHHKSGNIANQRSQHTLMLFV